MKTLKINFTKDSLRPSNEFLDSLWEDAFNIAVEREYEEAPMPWDAGWEIEYDQYKKTRTLILSGGAGASGYGYCEVKVPCDEKAPYFIEIDFEDEDHQKYARCANVFANHGYKVTTVVR